MWIQKNFRVDNIFCSTFFIIYMNYGLVQRQKEQKKSYKYLQGKVASLKNKRKVKVCWPYSDSWYGAGGRRGKGD